MGVLSAACNAAVEEPRDKSHSFDLHFQRRNVISRFFQKVRQRYIPAARYQPAQRPHFSLHRRQFLLNRRFSRPGLRSSRSLVFPFYLRKPEAEPAGHYGPAPACPALGGDGEDSVRRIANGADRGAGRIRAAEVA